MLNRTFLRLTVIEWIVLAAIVLLVARLVWARELKSIEDSLFSAVGLAGGAKYLVIVPIALWFCYRMYARERAKAGASAPVVRPQVLAVAALVLVSAVVFAFVVASA